MSAARVFLEKLTIIDMHLKLKRTPGLYLVGFMATGKTTIGGLLARHLGWAFSDVDSDIEQKDGRTIARIFLEDGEAAFREREAEALREHVLHIQSGMPRVLALGGGAFIQERNFQIIKDNGMTVWLDCPLDVVHQRIGDTSTRPLAWNREHLEKLFEDRRPLYSRADFRIDITTESAESIVQRIAGLPIF